MGQSLRRPRITLKLATSLDGKIALANGQSEWITCESSRAKGRELRAQRDAICVGANTAHLDNPQLTARISGQPDPVRVVFDSHARLSPKSNLAQTAHQLAVYLFCREESLDIQNASTVKLMELGVQLLPVSQTEDGLDVVEALEFLHRRSITSLLIEGGGRLAASFVRANLVDEIHWFRAPMILGGDGRDCIGALGLEKMSEARGFTRVSVCEIGSDLYEIYERGEE